MKTASEFKDAMDDLLKERPRITLSSGMAAAIDNAGTCKIDCNDGETVLMVLDSTDALVLGHFLLEAYAMTISESDKEKP